MINKENLPKGWTVAKLIECCESISLNSIKIKEKQYKLNGKIPVIDQGRELIGGYFDEEKYVIPSEPPYIVFGDHTKVIKYVSFKFIAGADGIKVLKTYPFISPKLFYYFIHVVKMPDKGYARHFQFLSNADFPLPPLPEQTRIVTKLEQLLSDLDKGFEYLQTAKQQLKVYRQAVLKWAFEGKLSNVDHNSNEWSETTVEKFADCIDNKRRPINKTERLKRKGEIPYYGANGITGWIDDYLFDEPLVLVVEDETFVGRELPFSYKITGKSWVNNHAHILKPKGKNSIDFLNYQLAYYPFLPLTTGTTGRKKLTKAKLMSAPIKTCSTTEQMIVVQQIESRLSVCDKIEETIKNSLQQAEALRLSIIKQAFEGKLVPQDPNDEPAEMLLERIKTERIKNNPVRKMKK